MQRAGRSLSRIVIMHRPVERERERERERKKRISIRGIVSAH